MPSRPVRVLIACDHIDHDGALHGGGRQLLELIRALQNSPHVEFTVVILRPATSLGRELVAEGVPLAFLGDHRYNPVSMLKLIRIIRDSRADVLHLTDFGADTWGRLAGAITRTPAMVQVITHHGQGQPRGYPWQAALANRLLAPLTSRVLAISSSVKDFAVDHMGFERDAVEVLHYPMPEHSFSDPDPSDCDELRRSLGIADKDPVIGAVTRFHEVKGIHHLVEAYAIVRKTHPDAWLLLVGKGPQEARLRARAEELGVSDRVVFAGFQRAVERFEALFTVSAVPSLEEGFGLVALESLRLGVPVVASDVGGLPDIVEHGKTGFLVPPANPEALADALLQVVGDPALHASMRAAAPVSTARFSLDEYAHQLIRVYREMAQLAPVPEVAGMAVSA